MTDSATEISRALQGVVAGLDEVLADIAGEKVGFTLMVFVGDYANYASNIERAESIEHIKRLIRVWETGMPDIPHHLKN